MELDHHASYQQTALLGATKFEKVNDQHAIKPLNFKKAEKKFIHISTTLITDGMHRIMVTRTSKDD